MPGQLVLFGATTPDWEALLIRGALRYHGISCRFARAHELSSAWADPCIELDPRAARARGPRILAGRRVTGAYLRGALQPTAPDVLVYGEPYALVPRLVRDADLLRRSSGTAVLGQLADPSEYRSAGIAADGCAGVLMSLGCEKQCGYCSHGAAMRALYPGKARRRERNPSDVTAEMRDCVHRGARLVQLLADQFLSASPGRNGAVRSLAADWLARGGTRIPVLFTVGPREVMRNKPLLHELFEAFDIQLTLGLESFDDPTLTSLHLDFDAKHALSAVRFLASLGAPMRVNYIFFRPHVTRTRVLAELRRLEVLADALSYLDAKSQLVIANDVFGRALRLTPGAPISTAWPSDGWGLPAEELVRAATHAQRAISLQLESAHAGNATHPLRTVIVAARAAVEHGSRIPNSA